MYEEGRDEITHVVAKQEASFYSDRSSLWLGYSENNFFGCYARGFGQLINEYSTGLVLAFYAVERLILVVFPFKSNAWQLFLRC